VVPGVGLVVLGVALIVRIDTGTLTAQRESLLPLAQLLPTVAEVIVLARILFPASGLLTVTENVIVATAPGARVPVQVRFGLVKPTVPAVAAALL
jgi:hypothetical protein